MISVEIVKTNAPVSEWIVESYGLSFWRPDYYSLFKNSNESHRGRGWDIHFDGVEISTDDHGRINEFGFATDVTSMKKVSIASPNSEIKAELRVLGQPPLGTVYLTEEEGEEYEDLLEFDIDIGLIQWRLANFKEKVWFRIATNVVIGLCNSQLVAIQAALLKRDKDYIQANPLIFN